MGDLFGADEPVPAISLWQPYASLLFVGEPDLRKEHETRGYRYPAKYEGRTIAIQAGLSIPAVSAALDVVARAAFGSDWRRTLPRGAYIGTLRLVGCLPTETIRDAITPADRAAGVWDDGRWAWQLADRYRLARPIPAKGKQGWWFVDLSQSAEAA